MSLLWNQINQFNIERNVKDRLFLGLFILMNLMLGGIIWYLAGHFLFPGIDGLLCFMGYPAVFIGFFGGILYLFNQMR